MSKSKYSVLIIGCGSIGALKPNKFDSPKTKNILTHAHAVYNNPRLEIFSFVDTDPEKAKKARKKWQFHNPDLTEPDIIVVSTPTKIHLEIFSEIEQQYNPRLIIGEKPLGNSMGACRGILKTCSFPILVNYSRRFNKVHKNIKESIDYVSEKSTIYSCTVYYGRGLSHDGCHAVDLMNWWFGELINIEKTNYINDGFKDTYGFISEYAKCPCVYFVPVNYKEVGMFEIEIMTGAGKYSLINNGTRFSLRKVVKGDDWGSYPSLGMGKYFSTRLTTTMTLLYRNAINFLDGKEDLKCTAIDALKVWEVFNQLIMEE